MIGAVLLALAPVALLVALGHGLKRSGFVGDAFWPSAERLCYYVLLPALFAHGLASARLQSLAVMPLALALVGSTVAVAATLLLIRPFVRVDGAGFTSVFQGAVRFNNYVGASLAAGLFGAQGIALAAVCVAAIVPTVNLMCVLVFARYGSTRLGIVALVRQIVSNPLVVACATGIAMQASGATFPPAIEPAVRALGAASMPLGLLCVGAALTFDAARAWLQPVCVASAFKFVAMPLLTLVAGRALELGDAALTVALLFQALPTSSASYLMARQLGGDAPLMAGITAFQTLFATIAMPAVLTTLVAASALR
ncbi:AEC family transporter [Burkholderia ubonensis]|uniref:AEC family transporter n=1 Tax=Burkholderia ubonensis TaxID=101571 RepID=UPI000BA7B0AF|nr:AEC family transporter [Burkholderia ubonensis]PAK10918.1 transporter [Burkholderia ubonensis]RQP30458.1 AEC family transporter [Burkholderia ubonensis]RQP33197.1 AEC family transporter [Burkholderia ubonensis]RQP36080.1 AEC family transporter [Burkholderia ubonensis]RQP50764.1 AEC family transporter [Burkholderia ubonensis]